MEGSDITMGEYMTTHYGCEGNGTQIESRGGV